MAQHYLRPDFNEVLIPIYGRFGIRWYSLLYVGGFIVGRYILRKLARTDRFKFTTEDVEQLILWLLIGCVIGARVIYCVVYDPKNLMADPLNLFRIYEGGLSFHGGLLGVVVASAIFARKRHIPWWNLADAMALAAPTGLAMGRLGNFINGELWGRVSYVPWAMIFRNGGPEPRHPSQLYELFMEGILLFAVLWFMKPRLKKDGQIAVLFLTLYPLFRFIAEFFREPDRHVGFVALGLTMGQILCLVMFVLCAGIGVWLAKRPVEVSRAKGKK